MKLSFYLFFSILIISACNQKPVVDEDSELEHQTEEIIHKIQEGDLEILTIDNCEYIVFKDYKGSNHGFGYMAHKGNCSNPIHVYRDTIPQSSDKTETTNQ